MDCSPINLRKIAILVSSIDACAAEQLLAEFPPDIAQHIRQAASDLDDVTSYQRQEILVEFQHEVAGVSCAPSGTGEDYQEPSACELTTREEPKISLVSSTCGSHRPCRRKRSAHVGRSLGI